jgi:membrane dipeptidase
MEECGEMVQLRTWTQVEAHAAKWIAASEAEAATLPIGYLLSLEGADSILGWRHLERSRADGLIALGPVHYGPGIYGCGTDDEGPLTAKGRELLKEMERLGIILDVTHLCDESMRDALDHFSGPVWASHHKCRALANWNRQLTDEQIKKLVQRGAVIGMAFDAIMMVHGWHHKVSKPQDFGLRIEKICEHIDHICQFVGNARHVGIGTDLDGGYGTEQTPLDLDSIADLTKLDDLLAKRGYSAADITGIFRGNFFFFLRENLKLRLLNARLSLLSRQFDTAQADLREAQSALDRYFDKGSRRVDLVREQLRQVAQQSRQVSVPRPEATLAALATAVAGR